MQLTVRHPELLQGDVHAGLPCTSAAAGDALLTPCTSRRRHCSTDNLLHCLRTPGEKTYRQNMTRIGTRPRRVRRVAPIDVRVTMRGVVRHGRNMILPVCYPTRWRSIAPRCYNIFGPYLGVRGGLARFDPVVYFTRVFALNPGP